MDDTPVDVDCEDDEWTDWELDGCVEEDTELWVPVDEVLPSLDCDVDDAVEDTGWLEEVVEVWLDGGVVCDPVSEGVVGG